ncbi:MAG: divalent-cation tolerance protein CutA [Pseudomonadota bacterium]
MKLASRFRLVFVTCGSERNAVLIARSLVSKKLAACVNIVPSIRSTYRWHGKIRQGREWLLLIKTRASLLEKARKEVRRLHSYEVPEFLSLSMSSGDTKYLNWLWKETKT